MSHCTFWPSKSFFYPIGNTPPVCLTQNLPKEENADVLLLGCGDPRSIFFTVYATGADLGHLPTRTLDITCCDMEYAVLARNILLFSFFIDDDRILSKLSQIWNIFYNMYLDESSLSLLISQSHRLLDHSSTLHAWHDSKYGTVLRMCTESTLDGVRRIWTRYVESASMTTQEKKRFKSKFMAEIKETRACDVSIVTGARSAGPLIMYAPILADTVFQEYSRSGILSTEPDYSQKATLPNPSFAYTSATGDKISVHYGTEPLSSFHLAEAFALTAGDPTKVTTHDLKAAVMTQFRGWCTAFLRLLERRDQVNGIIIRFFAGDALAFCEALQYYSATGDTDAPLYTGPWETTTIALTSDYAGTAPDSVCAPTKFNVIETSNLLDHVGLLNLLVKCYPLLQATPSATLFTEALVSSTAQPLTALLDKACMDLPMLSLLLGLTPAPCVAKYTTISNAHELLLQHLILNEIPQGHGRQFHERIPWKFASGSDGVDCLGDETDRYVAFADASKLADVLFDIYEKMFQHENPLNIMQINTATAVAGSGLLHYTRRSFVELLSIAKRRIRADWPAVLEAFDRRMTRDTSLLVGNNYFQDMYCQLHILGVDSVSTFTQEFIQARKRDHDSPVFRGWKSIPAVVCVALTIPRPALVGKKRLLDKCSNPVFQGELQGGQFLNAFGCIHVVYGTLSTTNTNEDRRGTLHQDPMGSAGDSPMVATFLVPTWTLLLPGVRVNLSVVTTPALTMQMMQLGSDFGLLQRNIFTAALTDERHVTILAERPNIPGELSKIAKLVNLSRAGGSSNLPNAEVSSEGSSGQVSTLTIRMENFDSDVKSALKAGAVVSIAQHSSCIAELAIAGFTSLVRYPIPVDVSKARLRVARKSSYVEVIAPPSLGTVGAQSALAMFPMFKNGGHFTSWSLHQIYLDRLPVLSTISDSERKWISPLLGLSLSDRERAIREASRSGIHQDLLMNVKESLSSIFLNSTGQTPHGARRVFGLLDSESEDSMGVYTLIFVGDIRLDLAAHSIIADAWVLPLTFAIMCTEGVQQGIRATMESTVQVKMSEEEIQAWMRLLPVLVERCRTWIHVKNCAYLEKAPPLSLEIGESPICQCGAGVGAAAAFSGKNQTWKPFAPYVTRAAISPLFPLSYMEPVGQFAGKLKAKAAPPPKQASCAFCGGQKEKLLGCGKCKKVKYCGADCQRKHWKSHKGECG